MQFKSFSKGKYSAVPKFYIVGTCLIIVGLFLFYFKYGTFKKEDFEVVKEVLYGQINYGPEEKISFGKNKNRRKHMFFSTYNYWFVKFYSEDYKLVSERKNDILKDVSTGDTIIFTVRKGLLDAIQKHSNSNPYIYSFASTEESYLDFDINKLNSNINEGDRKAGIFFITLGLIFNILGFRKYKKIKNDLSGL